MFRRVLCVATAVALSSSCLDPSDPAEQTARVKQAITNPNGPDISIDREVLARSTRVVTNATVQEAEVEEGCAGGTTGRTLVRFDVKTPNHGPADLAFGSVECVSTDERAECRGVSCFSNPSCCCGGRSACTTSSGDYGRFFEFACAHGHIHFTSFAEYRLLDGEGNVAARGHKQSFCLMDIEGIGDASCNAPNRFTCGNQGIHAGCADVYSSALPCSFVDATGVPRGDYTLEVNIDPNDAIDESNEANNIARVPVHLEDGPPPPPPPARQRFLVRDGIGTPAEAEAYYAALEPGGFSAGNSTVEEWREQFIGDRPIVSGFYRNSFELGYWREMTCTASVGRDYGGCFVRNWESPDDFENGGTPHGTVAMRLDRAGRTQFYAFNDQGVMSLDAVLDSEGPKSVPRACTPCHGGEYTGVGNNSDLGSVFREFEPSRLQRRPGQNEEEAQRVWSELNRAVRSANRAVRGEREGGPFGVDAAKAALENYLADPSRIPESWLAGATAEEREAKISIWQRVVNPYCQTCHRLSPFNYENYARFQTLAGITDGRPLLRRYVDVDPEDPNRRRLAFMPQSELLWRSLNTDAEALIAMDTWLGLTSNEAPIAEAGPNQTVRGGASVAISASESRDPEGDPLSFTWTQIAGPAVTLAPDNTSRDVTFVAPGSAELVFRLLVRDSRGAEATDEVNISASPATTILIGARDLPLAIPDNTPAGIRSNISVDEDRVITALQARVRIPHTWIGDLLVTLRGPGGLSVVLHDRSGRDADNIDRAFTVAEAIGRTTRGVWSLDVVDTAGADLGSLELFELRIDTAELAENRAPIAEAGVDQQVVPFGTVRLSAARSIDPDGDPLRFQWIVVEGPPLEIQPSASSSEISFVAPPVPGAVTLQLLADDGRGGSDDDRVTITVATGHPHLEVVSADTPIDVPDASTAGIHSTIEVGVEEAVSSLEATIEIDHPYIGDLLVVLEGPGVRRILHDRIGGRTRNLRNTYLIPEAAGGRSGGVWRLLVSDHAGADVGVLLRWSLNFHFGEAPPAPDVDIVEVTAADLPIAVPDFDNAGISSRLEALDDRRIVRASVAVDIEHTFIGDLRVILEAPDGSRTTLHDITGGSFDNLVRTYDLPAAANRPARGTWRLSVSDVARADTGVLRRWSVRFELAR